MSDAASTSTSSLVLASFASPDALLAAIVELRRRGYTGMDAYSPFPIDGMEEALGLGGSRVPTFVLGGGLIGAASGYLLQWYCNVINFPLNIGGRPAHSPASFIPITFELTILLGALSAFLGLFCLLRLPRLHHPVFTAPEFRRASIDRYWVSIAVRDTEPDEARLSADLIAVGGADLTRVDGGAR